MCLYDVALTSHLCEADLGKEAMVIRPAMVHYAHSNDSFIVTWLTNCLRHQTPWTHLLYHSLFYGCAYLYFILYTIFTRCVDFFLSCSSQLEMNQSSIQVTMLQLLHQTEEVMPKLIKQSTQLHVLPIISGDYNLKLARQDYFSAKQDQVWSTFSSLEIW